jgi:polyferredoxin
MSKSLDMQLCQCCPVSPSNALALTTDAMSGNTTFKQIPIVVESAGRANLGRIRAASRIIALALIVLIPLTGIFRIDVSSGFVIFNKQIWFSDFFIVFGFWLSAACLLILLYSSMGTVFCGWVCPQNTVSTWANKVTSRLLGKRAILNWGDDNKSAKLSSGKNHWWNWLILGTKLVATAMLLAMIPMLYFLPPGAIWSFVTLQQDARFTSSLYWIYTVFSFIALANIAVVRHYVCRYMCIYRMWQFLFKTQDTLHIEYDASRGQDCAKCNYCATSCPVEIDPRNTITFDSCTNCGECISACDSLYEKDNQPGLLSYKFGPRLKKPVEQNKMGLATVLQRISWLSPVFILAVGIFTWGIISYQPYHLSVYRAEIDQGDAIHDYRINIANKTYSPASVSVRVEGLPPDMYHLDSSQALFTTADRKDLNLHINDSLPKGFYTISVFAQSADGWRDQYQIKHFEERG